MALITSTSPCCSHAPLNAVKPEMRPGLLGDDRLLIDLLSQQIAGGCGVAMLMPRTSMLLLTVVLHDDDSLRLKGCLALMTSQHYPHSHGPLNDVKLEECLP